MKQTIFTLFLGVLLVTTAFTQPTGIIIQASDDTPPVIDGIVDDVWKDAEVYNIDIPFADVLPTLGQPGETTWQGLWTYDGIYVLLIVNDDAFYPHYSITPAGYTWEYDKPELYFDVNYDLYDGIGPSANQGHYQVAPPFTDGQNDGTPFTCGFNGEAGTIIDYAMMVEDPNYVVEYYIPFSSLLDRDDAGIDITSEVGFDVTIIDRDPGDDANKSAVWSNNVDGSWSNMDDAGIITFDGAEAGVYIESIFFEDVVIDENNGMVQVVPTILPEDASNKNLKWTLTNIDGKATVDSDGWVKGIMDGTCTLFAEAKDGSYVDFTANVTISNQIVSKPEINLIKNGYFKQVNADGSAAEWSGTNTVQEGGIVELDPPAGGTNLWDFSMAQLIYGTNNTDEYTFSFRAWAVESDTFNVDFEDFNANYNRYGTSNHPLAIGGQSDWLFLTETVPTKYVFDVIFDEKTENSNESMQFMLGHHDPVVYIDSVELIKNNDLALLTDYEEVTDINVTSAGGATVVGVGATLQMSAEVLPEIADYPDVKWSVDDEEMATIDDAGLLTGVANGTVMVYASAVDDSEVMGEMEITVGVVGISEESAHTLMVYPNPAINELNVVLTSDNTTVSIYNSVGMKMDEVVVSGTEHRFDISSYAYGVYFVKTDNAVAKFVK